VDDLLYRFSNKALGDTNERVSRDIARKLAPDDRLLGAVKLCEEQAVPSGYILLGIAAARLLSGNEQKDGGIFSELQSALTAGFDFSVIQEIIQRFQFSNKEMIV
jgi:mannitol-1-phosphate/altronate dehydrogenase